jgi:hypothetical protein
MQMKQRHFLIKCRQADPTKRDWEWSFKVNEPRSRPHMITVIKKELGL